MGFVGNGKPNSLLAKGAYRLYSNYTEETLEQIEHDIFGKVLDWSLRNIAFLEKQERLLYEQMDCNLCPSELFWWTALMYDNTFRGQVIIENCVRQLLKGWRTPDEILHEFAVEAANIRFDDDYNSERITRGLKQLYKQFEVTFNQLTEACQYDVITATILQQNDIELISFAVNRANGFLSLLNDEADKKAVELITPLFEKYYDWFTSARVLKDLCCNNFQNGNDLHRLDALCSLDEIYYKQIRPLESIKIISTSQPQQSPKTHKDQKTIQPELPYIFQRERGQRALQRGIEKVLITQTETSYKWNGKKADFAYLVWKLSDEAEIPYKAIGNLFGISRLDTSINNVKYTKKPRPNIDELLAD